MAATKKNPLLRKRAIAAAATLLGTLPAAQAASNAAQSEWSSDTSFLFYKEADRITVIEPEISLKRKFSSERELSVLVTVDSISGATPSGTLPNTPNTVAQTVTSPSGTVLDSSIGEIPKGEMTDIRYAMTSSWLQPIGKNTTGRVGGLVSAEKDYLSLGLNASIARVFNKKNTTLTFGISPEFNLNSPVDGLPVALANPALPGAFSGKRDEKTVISGMVGLTHVLNKRTLMQLNYALTRDSGYLNDPYKLLSVVNANGDPLRAIFENRPDKRTGHSIYWLTKRTLRAKDVFSLAVRFFWDDWGIGSETIDVGYRWQLGERTFIEPHVRRYHQTAADFYRVGLLQGEIIPSMVSSDYRLSDFSGLTFGLRTGWVFDSGSRLVFRIEYYTQNGDDHPRSAVGLQRTYDLFPDLDAVILQLSYTFDPASLFRKK